MGSIGNSQSLNRYSYVQGNPVSYTDPFGLSPLNGLFSGTMLVHAVCELLGWIPGPVGAIANIVDGLVYLLVDKDYKNAFYSIGTGLSFGVGKIVGAVGKGSKTALRVQRVCNAVGNGINFAQCAEGTVQMGGMMIDKYIVQGQPLSGSTVKELFLLGAYMFSGSKSGSALATDVKDFGRLVKGSWTAKGTSKAGNAGQGGSSSVLVNANYAQKTYGNRFSEVGIKKYTELAGEPINTIDDMVNAINLGKIKVNDVPIEYIVRDGNTLILNTRTSQALTQAGIPRNQWNAIDRTGNAVFESMLDGQLSRNKLTSAGIDVVRPSGGKNNESRCAL